MIPGPADEFLAKYGDKGLAVLKAIIAASRTRLGGPRLGDFSYKDIKEYLARHGISYNPSLLLSKLEKEYGLIETTYKSGGQHWWRVIDLDSLEAAIQRYDGGDDSRGENELPPRARMLLIQFYALEPERILETLHRLSRRKRLSQAEQGLLRRVVFEDLPRIVEFLEEAEASYPEELEAEIMMAEAILEMAEKIVAQRRGGQAVPSIGREARLESPLLRRRRETL